MKKRDTRRGFSNSVTTNSSEYAISATRWPSFTAAALGLIWFAFNGGYAAWNPFDNSWLLRSAEDFTQHYIGWAHFRNAAWSFPLGQLPDLGWPVGTSVAMTDSNPLLCVLLKPFSALLPDSFQFQGPFMALCFALQGYIASEVLRFLGARPLARLMGAVFFVLAPPFLYATRHEVLTAHWLIIWSLGLCVVPLNTLRPVVLTCHAVCIAFLATALNPYLLAMVGPLLLAAIGRWTFARRPFDLRTGALSLASVGIVVASVAYSFGYLQQKASKTVRYGFGVYASDLTTFFSPRSWSRFLPNQPERYGQYEGFAYFGLGMFMLVGAALYLRIREGKQRYRLEWVCVGIVGALLAVYAMSDTVCWRGKPVVNLREYTSSFLPLLSIFRSSGRFINVPFYALLLWAIATIIRRRTPQQCAAILLSALVLQMIDVKPRGISEQFLKESDWPLRSPAWAYVGAPYKHIAIFPPNFTDSDVNCGVRFPPRFELPFGVLASWRTMTVNSAFAGYVDRNAVVDHCKNSLAQVQRGDFDSDTIYVVEPRAMKSFTSRPTQMTCGQLDKYNVCVQRGTGTQLEAILQGAS